MKILIVEDEKDLNYIIQKKLIQQGYNVEACYDGETALDYLECGHYDAVILDIMIPKIDGLEIVSRIRKRGDITPVLFLTAKDSVSDRVKGLDVGGDDYLVKPFEFEELMAGRAVKQASNLFTLADLSVDCETHIVKRVRNIITLSTKEFAVLEYMICHKEIVLSREKIEDNVWKFDQVGGSNVVDVYIRYLRKKIDEGYPVKLIHTIRGAGYTMREEEN